LNGGKGNDTLVGGKGDDTYYVDSARDIIKETISNANEGGIDTVHATFTYSLAKLTNVDNLVLDGSANIAGTGNALDNTIVGNAGKNSLAGGAGDDTLEGGKGNDTIDGGTGTDHAVFSGNAQEYQVTQLSGTSFRITDLVAKRDGVDAIKNVEL